MEIMESKYRFFNSGEPQSEYMGVPKDIKPFDLQQISYNQVRFDVPTTFNYADYDQMQLALYPLCATGNNISLSFYTESKPDSFLNAENLEHWHKTRAIRNMGNQNDMYRMLDPENDGGYNIRVKIINIGKMSKDEQTAYIEAHRAKYPTTEKVDLAISILAVNSQRRNFICYNENQVGALVVITNKCDEHFLLKLISVIPALCIGPWFNTSGIMELDTSMFLPLGNLDADAFYAAFDKWYSPYKATAKQRALEKSLSPLKQIQDGKFAELRERLASATRDEEVARNNMINYATKRKAYMFELLGRELSDSGDAEEFIKYLSTKRSAVIDHVSDVNASYLRLTIKTQCINYDTSILERFFKSERSVVQQAPAWAQQLLKDVFIDQKFIMNMAADIHIDFARLTINRASSNLIVQGGDAIASPHIVDYDCWGGNKNFIVAALQENDYITAFEQIVSAVGSLNFADPIVFGRFINYLTTSNGGSKYRSYKGLVNVETGENISVQEYEKRHKAGVLAASIKESIELASGATPTVGEVGPF